MADFFGTLETGLKSAWRITQTNLVLAETGLGWLMGERPPAARLLRQTFERLGATYIKLGQFIASAPSLFGEEYVQEFQKVLDKTDPLPFREIERVIRQELGRPSAKVFAWIDKEPLASASIAQVHAARLHSGEEVVIKVQKPGVYDILITDLNFLYVTARALELIAPGLSRTSLSAIIDEIQKTMVEECDFIQEASNIKGYAEFLDRMQIKEAIVPRVYDDFTTTKVLTMERFYGVPLTDLDSIRAYTAHPEKTLITALNTWFASLLYCDFFHADVHAGNLMVLEDGRIGFIDFGIVGRISKKTWQAMNTLMETMQTEDYRKMARALIDIGATDAEVDEVAFARDLEKLFRGIRKLEEGALRGGNIDDNDINRAMFDLVDVGEKHGIRFPREFALLMKQFLYFDRYTRILAPDLDMFSDTRIHSMIG